MPNVDGGHYWLTALIPVCSDPCRDADLSFTQPINLLRRALALMPTAQQSPASVAAGRSSPFSFNDRNHFVRFAVIDAVAYNGRDASDGLVQAIRRPDMNKLQPVDRLASAYLLFAAEFDAPSGHELELEVYLDTLWRTIPAQQLDEVFSHCVGWDSVASAADFCRYIRRCQVTTGLPFNDYWLGPPPWPNLPIGRIAATGAAIGAALAAAGIWLTGRAIGDFPWWLWLLGLLVAAAVVLVWLVRGLNRFAAVAWPKAPGSDLPSILKALYLQRGFVEFATKAQGLGDDELHRRFGAFVAATRPDEATPTQQPGVINAAALMTLKPAETARVLSAVAQGKGDGAAA